MICISTIKRAFIDNRAADRNMDILKNLKRTKSYGGTPGKGHHDPYIPSATIERRTGKILDDNIAPM